MLSAKPLLGAFGRWAQKSSSYFDVVYLDPVDL